MPRRHKPLPLQNRPTDLLLVTSTSTALIDLLLFLSLFSQTCYCYYHCSYRPFTIFSTALPDLLLLLSLLSQTCYCYYHCSHRPDLLLLIDMLLHICPSPPVTLSAFLHGFRYMHQTLIHNTSTHSWRSWCDFFSNLNKENSNLRPMRERKWERDPVCLVARWRCVPCVSLLGDQKARSACSQAGDGVVWFPRRRLSLTPAANHGERIPAAETRLLLKWLAVTGLAQRGTGGRSGQVGRGGRVKGSASQPVCLFSRFLVFAAYQITLHNCSGSVCERSFNEAFIANEML